MKKHTLNFKNNIKEMGRELNSIISYSIGTEKIELSNSELNSVKPSFQSSLLKSVMKELDIDSNVEIPIGTIVNYKLGISLNGSEYEYINYGNYIVYSIEKQEDTNSYSIICYDKMLFSMIDYKGLMSASILNATFPMTIRDYLHYLCTDIGLAFKNKNSTFANYDKIIESDLYAELGYTYRDIFDELAQVTASNIIINNNDEVEIKYINNTNDTINEEYLKDINVNFGEKYGPINSIVLSRASESDNVYLRDETSVIQNGLCELKISENQIMNFNDRSDYLPDILEKLNGLEYYLNDFSSTGICYYEVCDKYNVQIENNIYPCVMFNDEIDVEQGLEEKVHTDLPEQAETDYTKADKTDRKINQTYLIVDKQNQIIEAVVSEQKQIEQDITTSKQTSGNPIEVNDAGEYNLESIGIDGKSYQAEESTPTNPQEIKTVQGVTNLFNFENSVKGCFVNTTIVPNANWCYNIITDFKIGETYCTSGGRAIISFFNGDTNISVHNITNKTIVVPTNTTKMYVSTLIENDKFQLEKGTVAHRYVPYGTWLQQITIGVNKFNGETEHGGYNINTGIEFADTALTRNKYPIKVESSKEYIFSNNSVGIPINILEYDENYNFIGHARKDANVSFITNNKTRYINWYKGNNNEDKIQLNLGTNILPYEDYKENTALIDMNKSNLFEYETSTNIEWYTDIPNFIKETGIYTLEINNPPSTGNWSAYFVDEQKNRVGDFIKPLSSVYEKSTFLVSESQIEAPYIRFLPSSSGQHDLKNYSINVYEGYDPYYEFVGIDEVKDEFLNGLLTKNIEKLVLTGDEGWIYNPTTEAFFINRTGYKKYKDGGKCISTHFTYQNPNANKEGIWIGNDSFILIRDYNFTTADEFKTFLKQQYTNGTPVIVYYILDTSKTYQLPYKKLKLHKGYNYITLNDDLYPNMEIKYLTDSKFNAEYMTHAQFEIESNRINSEINKKVSNTELDEVIEEQTNKFTQEITDSANTTKSELNTTINNAKNEAISSANSTTDNKLKNYSTTVQMNNAITQSQTNTENAIMLEVSNKYDTKEQVNAKLELKVGKNDNDQVVSMINASAEEINLKGNRFSLQSTNCSITKDGTLTTKNGNFTGQVNATSGNIGGWKLDGNGNLYSDYGNYRTYLQNAKVAGGDSWVLSAQEKISDDTYSGGFILYANGNIESWKSIISHDSIQSYGNIICGQIEVHNPYPYIDFHWNSTVGTYNEDYTTRIIEREYGVLSFLNASGWANCRGGSWTNSSSRLVKKNIEEISETEAKALLDLKAVSFDYKNGVTTNQRGFIAEDVMEAMPDYVYIPKDYDESKFDNTEDENGNIDITQDVPSLDYSKFVVPLVKLCQMQQKQIDGLIERIKKLESR